jgi:hypothetical protein
VTAKVLPTFYNNSGNGYNATKITQSYLSNSTLLLSFEVAGVPNYSLLFANSGTISIDAEIY